MPAYTPIPLPVLAALRHLSGDEFKLLGAFCYYTYTQHQPQLTLEQLQAFAGVSPTQLKPMLHRLGQRGWVVPDVTGGFYQLALQLPEAPVAPPVLYDAALGVRPPRPQAHLLYPDGPWLTPNGLLNEDFVHDRAQVWRTGDSYQAKAFGAMAIEDVLGAVCKHYAKPQHHANLEIDWQSYCRKNQRYLANVHQRLQAGVMLAPQEQATALQKLPLMHQQVLPLYEPLPLPEPSLPLPEPSLPLPEPSFPPPSPPMSQPVAIAAPARLNWKAMLPDRTLAAGAAVPSSEVEQLRCWLADPILRAEAVQRARSRGYTVVYSEMGVAIDVQTNAGT
jgi:hypothetical protein